MMRRTAGPVVLAVAVAAGLTLTASCTSAGDDEPPPVEFDPGQQRLVAFDSCAQAEEQLRAAAREHLVAAGTGIAPNARPRDGVDEMSEARDVAPDAAQAGQPEAGQAEAGQADAPVADPPAHSDTNVHEEGVDEPDLVKTDGSRIVTVGDGTLHVIDAATQTRTGTLDLFTDAVAHGQAADLMLQGDRAFVLVDASHPYAGGDVAVPEPSNDVAPIRPDGPTGPATPSPDRDPITGPRVLLVDVSDEPRLISEYTVDGKLVDARAVGTTARVVVRSQPRLAQPSVEPDASEAERLAAQRQVIEDTEASDWLPRYETTAGDRVTAAGQVDCTAVNHPETYSGTSMLTVLTFDLTSSTLGDGAPVTMLADSETVYSNGPSLYVASDRRWQTPQRDPESDASEDDDRTEIHKFDTSDSGQPRYVGSGTVDGWLINQYAMSAWDGHLRVATTSGEAGQNDPEDSESTVYVLEERDDALVEVGSVGGLGKGERIYSVRFVGAIGYVVTFRETDPLYTVDLRDPAAPDVLGQLKITGYSSYLHPIGEGRLVGVGQEADEQGRVQGTQVSLFDVSNLSDPQRVAMHHVPQGSSEAEADPHAFLWWPDEQTLVMPLAAPDRGSGALVLQRDDDTFTERGLVSHPTTGSRDMPPHVTRSLVIGDTLWTVSGKGVAAHELSTLDRTAWVPF